MLDDFVVFLIGMRVNRPWKIHKWLPVFSAMPRMLRWLDQHPDAGLLGWHNAWIKGPAVVQYWRSFEDLDRFARGPYQPHLQAWSAFNKAIPRASSRGRLTLASTGRSRREISVGRGDCGSSEASACGLCRDTLASRRASSSATSILSGAVDAAPSRG